VFALPVDGGAAVMTGVSGASQRTALAPVRARLLRRAERDADAALAAARADAAARIASARAQADAVLQEARVQGAALAAAEASARRSSARRRERALELAVEREVYEAVRDGVERRVRALRDEPGYPDVRGALEVQARALLGPDAEIVEDPGGGVLATAPGRRVDLTLRAIAARAMDALGEEVTRLWTA
jgi:vacuolar-type H+-ATPase subunit E/Vma4